MPSTKMKLIITAILLATIAFLFLAGGGGDPSTFGNVSLFPKRDVFTPLLSPITNYTTGTPITHLDIFLNSKAAVSVGGGVLIYDCNWSKKDEGWLCGTPQVDEPLLKLPVRYGKAAYRHNHNTTTATKEAAIYMDTPYAIYFKGDKHFYDAFFGEETFARSGSGEYALIYEVDATGTFMDMVSEAKPINGQPSTDLHAAGVEVGCFGGCDEGETLFYNVTKGDGEVEMDISITCGGYGATCRDVVLYFFFDFPKPEGNEIIKPLKAELLSGHDLHMPKDLFSYFKNQNCAHLGDMAAGQSAHYRLHFTFREAAVDKNDPFCIQVDDLNHGKDIYGGAKAAAVEVCMGFVE